MQTKFSLYFILFLLISSIMFLILGAILNLNANGWGEKIILAGLILQTISLILGALYLYFKKK